MRILLMGNPNVGKSVLFNRLTGVAVITANYPGTTVEFTQGSMRLGGERAQVIDVPGTYSLEPTCRAEEVAVRMLEEHTRGDGSALGGPAVVVNVVDATNLERSLNLTLQLLGRRVPLVVSLNLWDEAAHTGIGIDAPELSRRLGVPCVPTCAVTGEGVKGLVEALAGARTGALEFSDQDRWGEVGRLVEAVQRVEHRHHLLRERLSDATARPLTALPLALLVGALSFLLVKAMGEGLIGWVVDPLFAWGWTPLMERLSAALGGGGFLHGLLVGRLALDGGIDLAGGMGLLTSGFYISVGAVLPYVFSFYLVLSLLEDTGYLPRLAVLMDTLMHRLGMHGMAIVPLILGLGCNVPGALSTRLLETRRERFIAATIMAICVPCTSQMAVIAGLVGHAAGGPLAAAAVFLAIFGTLGTAALVLGLAFNRFLPGESSELLIDIPPYRKPYLPGLLKKLWLRIGWFLREAVPWVLAGVALANALDLLGVVAFLGRLASPVVETVLGLPREAVGALVMGFLRKDVAVGMLAPLGLDWRQVTVAAVVLTMYFPCLATFTVLLREFGPRDLLRATCLMVVTSLTAGGALRLILGLL